MTYVRRFFAFLGDFLVGDAPELFVGPIAALGVTWLAFQAGLGAFVTGSLLVIAVLGVVALHIAIALRGATGK